MSAQCYASYMTLLCCCRIAVDKIKDMDDAFRQQLDVKERKHIDVLRRLETEKQEEVNAANKKVRVM